MNIAGESTPLQACTASSVQMGSAMDAHNIAFAGSTVVSGNGCAVVIRTANNTFIGKSVETKILNRNRTGKVQHLCDKQMKRGKTIMMLEMRRRMTVE
jgi:magnesium-transporting ATPase (P-type)